MASFLVCCRETLFIGFFNGTLIEVICVESLSGAHHFLQFLHGGRLQLGQSGGQLVSLSLLLWWDDPAGAFNSSAKEGRLLPRILNQVKNQVRMQKTGKRLRDLLQQFNLLLCVRDALGESLQPLLSSPLDTQGHTE